VGKLPRRDAFEGLYRTLAKAPPNVASLKVHADGSVEATFWREQEPQPTVPGAPPPKLVPGTVFVDDDSPINAADLTLNPPDLDERN